MYFDTASIVKFYFNEPDSPKVRQLVLTADTLLSSMWALAEFHGVIHRRLRDGSLAPLDARELSSRFYAHVEARLWLFIPVNESLLRRTSALIIAAPPDVFIRVGDALHLVTAREAEEREIWTNDRHMLASAAYFGVTSRSV